MFNDNLYDFLLDNINKIDFLDSKFLINFRKKLISLEPDIQYSLLSIRSGNQYDYSWYEDKTIYLSYEMINSYIKDYKKRYMIDDTLFIKNMCILESLIHELTHAYQFMWKFTREDLITDVLNDGDKIFNSIIKFKVLDYILTTCLYELYHDIYPFEIHADNMASLFLMNLYDLSDNKSDFTLFKHSQIKNILSKYSVVDGEIISPLSKFYKKMKMENKYTTYNFNSLSLIDRLILGELSNIDDINKILNEYMNTINVDYKRLIKH